MPTTRAWALTPVSGLQSLQSQGYKCMISWVAGPGGLAGGGPFSLSVHGMTFTSCDLMLLFHFLASYSHSLSSGEVAKPKFGRLGPKWGRILREGEGVHIKNNNFIHTSSMAFTSTWRLSASRPVTSS